MITESVKEIRNKTCSNDKHLQLYVDKISATFLFLPVVVNYKASCILLPRKCKNWKKKLRDVQQEREGTSLNYFKIFFNYIKQIFGPSHSIFLCLGLSQSILDYLGLSQSISVYLGLSWSFSVYLRLFWTVLDYLGLFQTILDYLGLSQTFRLSRTASNYLNLSLTI